MTILHIHIVSRNISHGLRIPPECSVTQLWQKAFNKVLWEEAWLTTNPLQLEAIFISCSNSSRDSVAIFVELSSKISFLFLLSLPHPNPLNPFWAGHHSVFPHKTHQVYFYVWTYILWLAWHFWNIDWFFPHSICPLSPLYLLLPLTPPTHILDSLPQGRTKDRNGLLT